MNHQALVSGSNPPRLLKADPAYRRRVLLFYAVCVPLALGLFVALRHWGVPMLTDHVRRSGDDGLFLFKVLGIASMSIPLGACCYLFHLGRRIRTSAQMPAPGTKVIRDTPIVYGPAARRLGMVVIVLSLVATVLVIAVAVRFARL